MVNLSIQDSIDNHNKIQMLKEEIDQVIAAVNCFSFSALK